MSSPADWIAPAIVLMTAVWGFFRHRDNKPTDAERANLLKTLAEDAAAFVLAAFPGKSWADLINMIVQRLLASPGVPTRNTQAVEGAASAALMKIAPAKASVARP